MADQNNAAAMREALERVRTYAQSKGRRMMNATWIYNVCDDALSAPVRNCDVGTSEEQSKRFEKFCESHPYKDGVGCRCNNCELDSSNCEFAWAQMPFNEEK